MGKTKRIKERKTKNYRKTRRRLKQRGGNISINIISKDIQNLSKEKFEKKYKNTLSTIFKDKYRYNCERIAGDAEILKFLFKVREGKTVDYKFNLYNVIALFLYHVDDCQHKSIEIMTQHIVTLSRELKLPIIKFIQRLIQEYKIPLPDVVKDEEVNDVAINDQPDDGYIKISAESENQDEE